MDNLPPSYLQATNRSRWSIISSFVSPYVRSQDLCSCALASREFNLAFTPHLWGNPASHFGTENNAVYVALVRFKRTLAWARLSTRILTHTLRLPPAHPELYEGPRAEWLRDLLQRLPKLQSLIVSGLPFFDHLSLMHLRGPNSGETLTRSLRLLEANRCLNATSSSLREAIIQFSSLTYLDLSRTLPARDPKVLHALQSLHKLQVLKLQGLGLRDEDIQVVSKAVGMRVRSLDLRDNRLTDLGIRVILQNCVMTTSRAAEILRANMVESGSLPRIMEEYFGLEIPDVFKTDDQDKFIYTRLTSDFSDRLRIEDTLGTGITHLYISGNNISVNAVADLLRIQRLHVLDVGNISFAIREKTLFQNTRHGNVGAECLIPLIEVNGERLTYLRIHHTVVTNHVAPDTPEIAEMDGGIPLSGASDEMVSGPAQELAGDQPRVQELPTEREVFELEGSPVQPAQSQTVQTPEDSLPESISIQSPPAPEASIPRPPSDPGPSSHPSLFPRALFEQPPDPSSSTLAEHIVSPLTPAFPTFPFSFPDVSTRLSESSSGVSRHSPAVPETLHVPEQPSHGRTYSGIMANHDSKVQYQKSQPHGLLPSMIPQVRTLVLTAFPTQSFSNNTATNFISFLTACAEEESWSHMQSKFGYEFPPGLDKTIADERRYAKSLFALDRIILETSPIARTNSVSSSSQKASKSSVEDPDCDVFWAAASDDYSFFGSTGEEECGVPESEAARIIPLEVRLGKMVVGDAEEEHPNNRKDSKPDQQGVFDILGEISKFRRQKKTAYQNALLRGDTDIYISGYWTGDITVLR